MDGARENEQTSLEVAQGRAKFPGFPGPARVYSIDPKATHRIDLIQEGTTGPAQFRELPRGPRATDADERWPKSSMEEGQFPPPELDGKEVGIGVERLAYGVDLRPRRMAPPRPRDRPSGHNGHQGRNDRIGEGQQAPLMEILAHPVDREAFFSIRHGTGKRFPDMKGTNPSVGAGEPRREAGLGALRASGPSHTAPDSSYFVSGSQANPFTGLPDIATHRSGTPCDLGARALGTLLHIAPDRLRPTRDLLLELLSLLLDRHSDSLRIVSLRGGTMIVNPLLNFS
jgi:hypothetical protein